LEIVRAQIGNSRSGLCLAQAGIGRLSAETNTLISAGLASELWQISCSRRTCLRPIGLEFKKVFTASTNPFCGAARGFSGNEEFKWTCFRADAIDAAGAFGGDSQKKLHLAPRCQLFRCKRRCKMNPKERRFTPRHKLQIPLTIQPLAGSNVPAQSTQSTDVSIRGSISPATCRSKLAPLFRCFCKCPRRLPGGLRPSGVAREESSASTTGKSPGAGAGSASKSTTTMSCAARCEMFQLQSKSRSHRRVPGADRSRLESLPFCPKSK
jgi:hypothetical protein